MKFIHFFKSTTVLITGASSGFGEEFARQLAPVAKALLLVSRRKDRMDALKTDLEQKYPGLEVKVYPVDLANTEEREAFCQRLVAESVTIDVLINNAGLGDHGVFETSDWDRIKMMLDVNIVALTALTHRILPIMRKNGSGAILNVSSIASLLPVPSLAVYAATKAYVTSFSEGIRSELRGSGISVTALCPGPVDTEFGLVADRKNGPEWENPEWFKVTPRLVVQSALKAVSEDRARVIPGILVALFGIGVTLLPLFILRWALNQYAKKLA